MIDDELRALLSVEPSPGFEAGIRTRAHADGPPSRWRKLNPAGLAIAAAITVAVGVGLLPRTLRQNEAPSAVSSSAQLSAPVPAATFESAPPNRVAPSHLPASSAATVPARRRTAPEVSRRAVEHPPAQAVQIDHAESRALQQLFASFVAAAAVDVAPPADSALVIPQIAIEPLALDIPSKGASQ